MIPAASDCPSQVDLSAYTDREGAAHVETHLAVCPSCSTVVAFYEHVNGVIKNATAPSESLTERIKSACRREAALERRRQFQLVFWRAAAAVALLFGLSALYLHQRTPTAAVAPVVAAAPNTVSPTPAVAPTAPTDVAAAMAEAEAMTGTPGATVDAADLAAAGTGRDGSLATPGTMHIAPNRVRHVWVVKDLNSSVKLFYSLLPTTAQLAQTEKAGDEGISFRMALPDKELQTLVDNLSTAGMSLVSPVFPQPGEKHKLLANGRNIIYDVEFVPGGQTEP